MDKSKVTIGIFIVTVLVLVGFIFKGNKGIETGPSDSVRLSTNVGAVASPDIQSNYLRVGGVLTFYSHQDMNTATTTVCAMQSPAATSSVAFIGVDFVVSTTTATTIHIASASSAYATTTLLVPAQSIASGGKATYATTTPGTVIGPNTYVVVGMQGGVGRFSPTGTCSAQFKTAL